MYVVAFSSLAIGLINMLNTFHKNTLLTFLFTKSIDLNEIFLGTFSHHVIRTREYVNMFSIAVYQRILSLRIITHVGLGYIFKRHMTYVCGLFALTRDK